MAAMNSSIHVKVLVVDDDWTSLSIVSSMLKKWSYEVVTVKSPVDAMATLRVQKNYFNLVVTDLHMPIMSGSELARQINLEFKSIPVILMSADDKESVIVECLASGAVYYIIKPINPEDLKNVWQYAAAANKGKLHQNIDIISDHHHQNTNTNNDNVNIVSIDSSHKRKMGSKDEEDDGGKAKKYKVVWTTVLHNLFLQAVRHIGLEKAVPKKILEFMAVPGLTRENVASHLQKYRLFLKRVAMRSAVPTRNILTEKTLRSSFAVGHPMLMMARNAQLNSINNNGQQQQQSLRLSTLFPAPRSRFSFHHPMFQGHPPHLTRHHRNNIGFGSCCGNNGYGIGMMSSNSIAPFGYANATATEVGLVGQTSSALLLNTNQFNNRIVPMERGFGGQRVLEDASNGEMMAKSYSLDDLISTNPTFTTNRAADNIDVDALFLHHINNPPQQQDGVGKEVMNSNGSAQGYNNNPQVNEIVIFDELRDLIPIDSANASWHNQSFIVQNQNQNQNQNQDCVEMVNSNFGSTTPYSYPYQNIGESSNIAQNLSTCSSQMGIRGGSTDADLYAMIQNINNTSDSNHQYLNDQQSWGDDGFVQ